MPSQQKPSFVFPYHDPHQQFNKIFKKRLNNLKNIFDGICISATPLTVKKNNAFLKFLEKEDCLVYKNNQNTKMGDHLRNSLKLFLESDYRNNDIFYGFIDNVLFALETHKREFEKDIAKHYMNDLIIFARSKKSWKTRPENFYITEQAIRKIGKLLTNGYFDWIWCACMIQNKLAPIILKYSKALGVEIMAEWNLIAYNQNYKLENNVVTWLDWEDPFWEKMNGSLDKSDEGRHTEKDETLRKLEYCTASLQLFYKYFKS